jgi:hypothetical protein
MVNKLTGWDALVGIVVALIAVNGGSLVWILCVLALFFWLRVRPVKITTVAKATEEPDNTFIVTDESDGGQSIDVDTDINHRPRKNHLRFYSHFDTRVDKSEYEYRIDGTDVYLRLLHDHGEDYSGGPEWEGWDVKDGVVLEADIRAQEEKKPLIYRSSEVRETRIAERIAQLKEQTEWAKLRGWNGAVYFILSKNLPEPDARRFFRQELERLKKAVSSIEKELTRLGFEPGEDGRWQLKESGTMPPEEDREKLWSSHGLSYNEFYAAPKLIKTLQGLLGETQ